MPEAGEERDASLTVNHRCPMVFALRKELGEEAPSDEVQFSVGLFGFGMPAWQPFEVVSTHPCEACGSYLRTMVQWASPRLFVSS